MSIIEASILEAKIKELTNDDELTQELVKVFNEHSDSDGILDADANTCLLKLESSLRFKKRMLETRDTKKELDKMQQFGDKYVDHLKEEIAAVEWAIDFIQQHSK